MPKVRKGKSRKIKDFEEIFPLLFTSPQRNLAVSLPSRVRILAA
jgi:hypothetical protein